MARASGNRHDAAREILHGDRIRTIDRRAVAQLSVTVGSPAPGSAVDHGTRGLVAAAATPPLLSPRALAGLALVFLALGVATAAAARDRAEIDARLAAPASHVPAPPVPTAAPASAPRLRGQAVATAATDNRATTVTASTGARGGAWTSRWRPLPGRTFGKAHHLDADDSEERSGAPGGPHRYLDGNRNGRLGWNPVTRAGRGAGERRTGRRRSRRRRPPR